jgi:hypothetical protein
MNKISLFLRFLVPFFPSFLVVSSFSLCASSHFYEVMEREHRAMRKDLYETLQELKKARNPYNRQCLENQIAGLRAVLKMSSGNDSLGVEPLATFLPPVVDESDRRPRSSVSDYRGPYTYRAPHYNGRRSVSPPDLAYPGTEGQFVFTGNEEA